LAGKSWIRAGWDDRNVNDQQVGSAFRVVRIRRRLRQEDVAHAAGVSTATISRLERGHFDHLSTAIMRQIAASLDIRLDHVARWRGGELDRVVNSKHAALHESVARAFAVLSGWEIRPEVSFAVYGERGIVDILAWHAERAALLVIELKTEIVDVNELIGTLDRKRRLGPMIARDLGWTPVHVGAWVIVAESRTNRRRIAEHQTVLRAAFPADGTAMRAWLREPRRPKSSLSMWTVDQTRTSLAPTKRVCAPPAA
jgi:transcriptional regulator with XRE-family HTH domain